MQVKDGFTATANHMHWSVIVWVNDHTQTNYPTDRRRPSYYSNNLSGLVIAGEGGAARHRVPDESNEKEPVCPVPRLLALNT
jgi:hypothetical protein